MTKLCGFCLSSAGCDCKEIESKYREKIDRFCTLLDVLTVKDYIRQFGKMPKYMILSDKNDFIAKSKVNVLMLSFPEKEKK